MQAAVIWLFVPCLTTAQTLGTQRYHFHRVHVILSCE